MITIKDLECIFVSENVGTCYSAEQYADYWLDYEKVQLVKLTDDKYNLPIITVFQYKNALYRFSRDLLVDSMFYDFETLKWRIVIEETQFANVKPLFVFKEKE